MVQNSEWGPHLWNILHICAEKCGKQATPILLADEIRAWNQVLELTEAILPCPLCQKHYRVWKKTHILSKFLKKNNPEGFYEAAQHWLWSLHNSINEQRGLEKMSFEEAKALYASKGTADLQQSLEKLMEVLERAKLQRLIDGSYIREWRLKLGLLRKFLRV